EGVSSSRDNVASSLGRAAQARAVTATASSKVVGNASLQDGGGSTISGRNKEVGAWCAGNPFESKRNPGTSTIGCGAASADRARSTTSSCCTPTATDRSTRERETDGPSRVLRGTLRKA